jgi:nitrogen-specific signal transduction histidine kinase/ActR/RegA family two-component response regulator
VPSQPACSSIRTDGTDAQLTAANSRLEAETEQRRIVEDRLRQAQKMEALGRLTGGIAHDFNILLTAIIGHIEMAQARIDDDPRLSGLLQVALRAADRGATLTGHLLAFARRQRLDPKAVDVAAAIRGVKDVLRQTIGPEIRIVTRTKHDLAAAWADPDQLEMAILNLALNARDAMQAGGKLLIVAENRRTPVSGSPPDLTPGDYVVVSVSDTGIGMEAETLTRAFEPFFTTKEAGRGSGLGLSIVHGFAAQSGGSVQISSSLGRGTKVDLWVPCSNELAVTRAAPDQRRSITGPRHGRILVCDDDADVRSVVAEVLRDSGYSVWEAETPTRALEVLGKEKAIDLFVVDYAMPEMNGLALIELARTSQYSLKVLLVSGHAEILKTGEIPGIPLLAKPFKTTDLIRRIAELLHPSEVGVERSDRSGDGRIELKS